MCILVPLFIKTTYVNVIGFYLETSKTLLGSRGTNIRKLDIEVKIRSKTRIDEQVKGSFSPTENIHPKTTFLTKT